jgi:hypothetical protein
VKTASARKIFRVENSRREMKKERYVQEKKRIFHEHEEEKLVRIFSCDNRVYWNLKAFYE